MISTTVAAPNRTVTAAGSSEQRSVQFARRPHEMFFTIARQEMSPMEKLDTWYSRREIKEIRLDLVGTVRSMRRRQHRGSPPLSFERDGPSCDNDSVSGVESEKEAEEDHEREPQNEEVCQRGLELMLCRKALEARERNKSQVVHAVLTEQACQRANKDVDGSSASNSKQPEERNHELNEAASLAIAIASMSRSRRDAATARALGIQDAEVLQGIDVEKEINEVLVEEFKSTVQESLKKQMGVSTPESDVATKSEEAKSSAREALREKIATAASEIANDRGKGTRRAEKEQNQRRHSPTKKLDASEKVSKRGSSKKPSEKKKFSRSLSPLLYLFDDEPADKKSTGRSKKSFSENQYPTISNPTPCVSLKHLIESGAPLPEPEPKVTNIPKPTMEKPKKGEKPQQPEKPQQSEKPQQPEREEEQPEKQQDNPEISKSGGHRRTSFLSRPRRLFVKSNGNSRSEAQMV